ncbi:MAG: 2-C-methyl-D-erythritol 2,4-cyclodiphosphate synthase [Spirochaetales bacterium]|nr:2-C-methyl-D-erythritol 2,4-cyclodiphosphate synthase [Spirochaetales bacterium]
MRIGFGYDIHRLVPGRKLMLGGFQVPSEYGEDGHSDGDTLIHALVDALLGGLALGDIGSFFPPSDPLYKNINSAILLKETVRFVKEKRARVANVDSTIILEQPKIGPFREKIRESLAALLEIEPSRVSIKAKTKEGADTTGRGEAVEAYVVVLLED